MLASLLLSGDQATSLLNLKVRRNPTGTVAAVPHLQHGKAQFTIGHSPFVIEKGHDVLLEQHTENKAASVLLKAVRLIATVADGTPVAGCVDTVQWEEYGPVRQTLCLKGRFGRRIGARFTCRVSAYPNTSLARLSITIENPRRAKHPGGYWDLGDPGSILFQDLSLEFQFGSQKITRTSWREQPGGGIKTTPGGQLEIYQDSSGGENWRSSNHVNRHGQVPLAFRGYRVHAGGVVSGGDRASPVVAVKTDHTTFTCAVEEFWQKFPTAIEVDEGSLRVRFLPKQAQDLHELQAGEHCTRVVWFDLSQSDQQPCERLTWVHNPPKVVVEPRWLAGSQCIAYFPHSETKPRPELATLLNEALTGPNNFFAKRETVDEFGWRHFGDVWADHEEQYSDDPKPVLSHYNNQYDLLYGMLVDFLRSGDVRWWQLADPLARHVMDIDIYHTTRDKSAYNGGMFWHTAHYHSVGTATHRSMSRTMQGKRIPAPGTGPSNEHNYSAGLLLYHFLTGCSRARQTVIGLADWVIRMDDGSHHLLGVVSDAATGEASRTTESSYHGPGRGAGNSINALLNAWCLTNDAKYLEKVSELVYRTVHPHDDIAARDLKNVELRWSYTVYLHALVNVLQVTAQVKSLVRLHRYIEASLLHYGRWMASNERLYLESPDQLEYPTETWAAQDLRKGTALLLIAAYASSTEAEQLRRRGLEILDDAWKLLLSFETRSCSRALALVLQQGYVEMFLRENTAANSVDETDEPQDMGMPVPFVPQKQHVKKLIRSPQKWGTTLCCVSRPSRWLIAIGQTWGAERLRRLLD